MKRSEQDRLEAIDKARKDVAECAVTLAREAESHKAAKQAYDAAISNLLDACDAEYDNLYNQEAP